MSGLRAGIDYAFAPPSLPCVVNAGYSFVIRYVGDPDPNPAKYLDAAELQVIRSLGLSVAVVRETTIGFMLTDNGAAHAQVSRNHCDALGLVDIPIYYALDLDPRNLNSAERRAVVLSLGMANVCMVRRTNFPESTPTPVPKWLWHVWRYSRLKRDLYRRLRPMATPYHYSYSYSYNNPR
jgi:hypothetical protein